MKTQNGIEYSIENRNTAEHPIYWLTFSTTTKNGETLLIEINKGEDDGSKHSLMSMWVKKNKLEKALPTWWNVDTYTTDTNGNCYGCMYNPTVKRGGAGYVIGFDWMLEATEENMLKLINEIAREAF